MAHPSEIPWRDRTWLRNPHVNNGSMAVTIPAAIRKALNWHMNAPLIITIVGEHVEVRQLDLLKSTESAEVTQLMARRRKSWKRLPGDNHTERKGYLVERPPTDKEPK